MELAFQDVPGSLGAQLGTPGDSRTQGIVGDIRARFPTIFTAVREVGPGQFAFTAALTDGLPIGSFDYVTVQARVAPPVLTVPVIHIPVPDLTVYDALRAGAAA